VENIQKECKNEAFLPVFCNKKTSVYRRKNTKISKLCTLYTEQARTLIFIKFLPKSWSICVKSVMSVYFHKRRRKYGEAFRSMLN
jgi:hypothetical protein